MDAPYTEHRGRRRVGCIHDAPLRPDQFAAAMWSSDHVYSLSARGS